MESSKSSDSKSDSNSEFSEFQRERSINNIYTPIDGSDKIVISVTDTGIGIKKKDKLKLFKLFGTLQNTRQMNTQGIGLGLVISENIVKAFDGHIGVSSVYGKGTTFAFCIPIQGKTENVFKESSKNLNRFQKMAVEKKKDAKSSVPAFINDSISL